jgi:hypothetical protein
MKGTIERRSPSQLDTPDEEEHIRSKVRSGTALRTAFLLSVLIAGLMAVASAAGLLIQGLYPDGEWAREALRGGDLVTLVVVVPLLIASLVLSARGSMRARLVWIAMLGYTLYNYAYYVFGAKFNDVFLLHIALLSMSIFALACAIPNVIGGIAARFRSVRGARWVGAFLVIVGIGQGALWIYLVLRFAATGQLLYDVPVDGQHLVFALDLSLLVPALVVAGVLLYRRTALGLVLGTAVSVFGAAYQLNLMFAGVLQANAGVAGAKAFPPEGILLTIGFVAASAVLLMLRRPTREVAR